MRSQTIGRVLIAPHHARTRANKAIRAWCPDGACVARTPQYDVICARDEEAESDEASALAWIWALE